jgi:hypothetical protein
MTSRISRLLGLAGLLGASLVALSSTSPTAHAAPSDICGVSGPPPCIVSAFRGAVPVDPNDISVDTYSDPTEAAHNTGFTISGLDTGDLSATYTVTMRTHFKPRVISMSGAYVSTSRYIDDGVWYAVVQATPVEILESCDNPTEPYCPTTASPDDAQIQLQGNINDAYWYPDNPDALHGLDQFSNINLFWYPPTISTSSTGVVTMDFLMENSRFYSGGALFEGEAQIRLPNRVLREFYGIPNPETMVDGSFTSISTSGTVSSYQEVSGDAWRVDVSDITFPATSPRVASRGTGERHLKLRRGVIVPTRPKDLVGTRVATNAARLAFTLSTPRGANVTGYQGRCVSPGGHVVSHLKTEPTSPVRVGGLRAGVPYSCKVRAKSKAGYGPWSVSDSVPRRP